MEENVDAPVSVAARISEAIYKHASRRGFLAKMSGALIGAGFVGAINVVEADAAPLCCCCNQCSGCPGINQCSPGWSWTGYTWTCCNGNCTVYCSDCKNNSTGSVCTCAYVRCSQPCNSPLRLSATELSRLSQAEILSRAQN